MISFFCWFNFSLGSDSRPKDCQLKGCPGVIVNITVITFLGFLFNNISYIYISFFRNKLFSDFILSQKISLLAFDPSV